MAAQVKGLIRATNKGNKAKMEMGEEEVTEEED